LRLREHAGFLVVPGLCQPRGLAFPQKLERLAEHARHDLRLLVPAGAFLGRGRDTLFQAFEVRQHQLSLDHFGVGDGIDLVRDVLDIVVLEAAKDMHNRVNLANIAEELVAQPFALARAFHETGDVDERQLGRHDLGRLGDRGNLVEPFIGNCDLAHIRLDRAERIVGGLRGLRFGEGVEQRRLADVGQADDSAAETHR